MMTELLGNNTGGSSDFGGMNNTIMNDLTNLHNNNILKHDLYGIPIITTTTTTGSTVTVTPDKLDNTNSIDWFVESDVISVAKTKIYSKIDNGKYMVNTIAEQEYITKEEKEFRNIRIKGTSLTLNDLYYDPDSLNHWLFIKDLGDMCKHDTTHRRNIIYYRSLNDVDSWDATTNDYQHKNHLYLFTGPCFTTDNLDK